MALKTTVKYTLGQGIELEMPSQTKIKGCQEL